MPLLKVDPSCSKPENKPELAFRLKRYPCCFGEPWTNDHPVFLDFCARARLLTVAVTCSDPRRVTVDSCKEVTTRADLFVQHLWSHEETVFTCVECALKFEHPTDLVWVRRQLYSSSNIFIKIELRRSLPVPWVRNLECDYCRFVVVGKSTISIREWEILTPNVPND